MTAVGTDANAPAGADRAEVRRGVVARRAEAARRRRRFLRDAPRFVHEGRWIVAAFLAVATCAAAAALFVTPPVYRAAALLQLAPHAEGALRVEEPPSPLVPRSRAEAESEILRSRSVVSAALDRLPGDVVARPDWFPIVGEALARHHRAATLAEPPLRLARLARYAWGGERLELAGLRVPEPLLGRALTLTALDERRIRLTDGSATLLEGELGAPLAGDTAAGPIELTVSRLVARPGTRFEVRRPSRAERIDEVLRHLRAAERFPGSGIVSVTYEAGSAAEAARVATAICSAYLAQDAERRRDGIDRTRALLDALLPKLEVRVGPAEPARDGGEQRAVGLALERRTGERGRAQVGPVLVTGDVERAAALWLKLLEEAQALRAAQAARAGEARVVDWPTPPSRPVRPASGTVLALAIVLGLAGGVATVLGSRAAARDGEDRHDVEAELGLSVLVAIPRSARELRLQRRAGPGARVLLALAAPEDPATEILRTLRTTLSFQVGARGGVVVVSSPSAGAGKSFVAANLAHLVAAAGQRVLLVDADLRRGPLHRYFSADPSPGLHEVLAGEARLEDAIRSTGTDRLELLPRGGPAHAPAELLAGPRLAETLALASERYDLVVVDTPAVLSATDALLAARCAGLTLLVLRARPHLLSEAADALDLFARSGVPVHGAVLNDARPAGTAGADHPRHPAPWPGPDDGAAPAAAAPPRQGRETA